MRKFALILGLFLAPVILLATDYQFRGNKLQSVSDTRIYFKGGTEATPTASGTDWFDIETDSTTASGDTI